MATYVLRTAGLDLSDDELRAEAHAIRLHLMEYGEAFLSDAFRQLLELVENQQVLVVERIDNGSRKIEGCIAFTFLPLVCHEPAQLGKVLRRVVLLRFLVVRDGPDRGELARRLALEAQLQATIQARYEDDDGPHAVGTLGFILESNARALRWAKGLNHRARAIMRDSPLVDNDATLRALRDFADATHVRLDVAQGYVLVLANRRNLIEAAYLHCAAPEAASTEGFQVRYEIGGLYEPWVAATVAALVDDNIATYARLGLLGPPDATPWGPPAIEAMHLAVPDEHCG